MKFSVNFVLLILGAVVASLLVDARATNDGDEDKKCRDAIVERKMSKELLRLLGEFSLFANPDPPYNCRNNCYEYMYDYGFNYDNINCCCANKAE